MSVKLSVSVSEELHRKLQLNAIVSGVSMSQVVEGLIAGLDDYHITTVDARTKGACLARTPQVYFIKQAGTGHIKIGTSNEPARRLKELQTASSEPLELLGVIDGGQDTEKALHRKFSSFKKSGEWYKSSPGLLRHLKEILP